MKLFVVEIYWQPLTKAVKHRKTYTGKGKYEPHPKAMIKGRVHIRYFFSFISVDER